MDDNVQSGLQSEHWLPVFEKGEKRTNSLGSGAFRFIRTRSSIRRELKRQCNRSKNGDSSMLHDVSNGGSGGGFGKWLREHLGGGSKSTQDSPSPLKANGGVVEGSGNEKPFGKNVYTSQNLYCSLPREHGRHGYNGARKTGHGNSLKSQGHDRQRSSSMNHQEKTTLSDLGTLTRGGPIYGSEGKTLKKRNRDRRRHSLNETHEQGRQRRRRLKELLNEQEELRRKNRLLELWVIRYMKKTQQRMTPSDHTKDAEQTEKIYKEALRVYKMQLDDILMQQAELSYELDDYTQRVRLIQNKCDQVFADFLERETNVAMGLIFAKTGKKVTDKMMNALIQRQMMHSELLASDRRRYIFLEHRLEDLHARLKTVETLGEGMTMMDYEVLHMANIGYKDRLDERDQELENLRFKIAETVNGVAHYKEKEVCILEDIEYEEQKLKDCTEQNTRAREEVNKLHMFLNEIRDTLNEKKVEGGLLFAQEELLEMERMMKLKDDLQKDISTLEQDIQRLQPPKQMSRRKTNDLTTTSMMSKIYDM